MNIKYFRNKAGLKQRELAEMIGIGDRSAIAKWETNQAAPRTSLLVPLANALKCSVDDLLRDRGDANDK